MKFAWLERFSGRKNGTAVPTFGGAGEDPLFLEQFKALRSNFEYRTDALKAKVVGITSSIAQEGKTVSCSYLATNLAGSGRKRVLLVDTDLRKSDLARRMGINPHPGLGEYLLGSAGLADVLRSSTSPGLSLVSGGARLADPSNLLAGDVFRSFLADVRDRFDLIILDTPPVIPVADTLGMRDLVDGFVFVFRARSTPLSMLKQAIEELGQERIIGVILNGVEPKTQRYYQRYYGKYYRSDASAGPTT